MQYICIAISTFTLDQMSTQQLIEQGEQNGCSYTYMVMQDDGNLVIFDMRTGNLCWARYGFVPGRVSKPKRVKILSEDFEIKTWSFSLPPL